MKKLVLNSFLIGGVVSAACTNTPGSPTVSFTSPVVAGPASGSSYKFKEQPVTVSITNAVRTAAAPVTYSVEVASDSAFSNRVFTKDTIAEGSGGTTSVTLSQLPASSGNTTYYWRWKAVVDGVTSPTSSTQSFVVQQQIIVNTPSASAPANGSTITDVRPTFVTRNATRQGAVGPMSYTFQVSASSSFGSLAANVTVPEGPGGANGVTTWTPATDLPEGTFFWRVQASDPANTEASPFSGAASFKVEPFLDMHVAEIINNPSDLADWEQTTRITSIDFNTGYMMVDFDERLTGRWPESDFGVEYTLGACFFIGGKWRCSAVIQFWTGRDLEASGPAGEIGQNWYYGRWGAMDGHQPAYGEIIGVFVAQGNLRDRGPSHLKERSNVVLIPFGTNYVRR